LQACSSRRKGSSIVETLASLMLIIAIAVAALDLIMLISASQINEHLAENAARAASSQICELDSRAAAATSLMSYHPSSNISNVEMIDFKYDPGAETVRVVTSMAIELPVPIVKTKFVNLRADAVQPIVGIPAPF